MFRQADRPGQRDPFEARGDIETVAHEVAVALLNDIAEMDADPKFDAHRARIAVHCFASGRSANRSTPTSWSGSVVTRST